MLNWHNKPWLKIISIALIIAFLTYDIAWATDFTPLQKKQYASRSLFKNKKVNQSTISSQNESNLNNIKDALSHKKNIVGDGFKPSPTYIKDIANIYINDTLGKVIDSYTSPNPKGTVIHIQDLHTNPEASLNLAGILDILIKDYDLNLVCSEGAEGVVDTSSVSSFPDKETKEKVAKVFVNSGELTGEEYLSITKYSNLPIWGIEDKDIYFQHIIEFNKIMKFSKSSLNLINQIKDKLNTLKPKIYSKALLDLDSKELEYEESRLDTAKYLEYLLDSASIASSNDHSKNIGNDILSERGRRDDNILSEQDTGDNKILFERPGEPAMEAESRTAKYKNIAIFKDTLSLEKLINQDKIIKQSQEILSSLQTILKDKDNKSELKALSVKASLFKDKKISPFSFYSYLKELALRHHVMEIASDALSTSSPRNDSEWVKAPNVSNDDPNHVIASPEGAKQSKYPDLIQFVDYLTKINSLDQAKLFTEIEDLSYDIKNLISEDNNQKLLTKSLRNIKFLESFFNLKLSNEDFEYYLKDKESFKESWFKSAIEILDPASSLSSHDRSNNNNIGTQYSSSGHESISWGESREESVIDKNLADLENFYELAHKRDLAMFTNTTAEIVSRKPKLTALITGGFHTQGITKLLKDNHYSYVVISPYSKTTIDEENYRNLLSGKRKPIGDLIKELNNSYLRPILMFASKDFIDSATSRLASDFGIPEASYGPERMVPVVVLVALEILGKLGLREIQARFKDWPYERLLLHGVDLQIRVLGDYFVVRYEENDQVKYAKFEQGNRIDAEEAEFETGTQILNIQPAKDIEIAQAPDVAKPPSNVITLAPLAADLPTKPIALGLTNMPDLGTVGMKVHMGTINAPSIASTHHVLLAEAAPASLEAPPPLARLTTITIGPKAPPFGLVKPEKAVALNTKLSGTIYRVDLAASPWLPSARASAPIGLNSQIIIGEPDKVKTFYQNILDNSRSFSKIEEQARTGLWIISEGVYSGAYSQEQTLILWEQLLERIPAAQEYWVGQFYIEMAEELVRFADSGKFQTSDKTQNDILDMMLKALISKISAHPFNIKVKAKFIIARFYLARREIKTALFNYSEAIRKLQVVPDRANDLPDLIIEAAKALELIAQNVQGAISKEDMLQELTRAAFLIPEPDHGGALYGRYNALKAIIKADMYINPERSSKQLSELKKKQAAIPDYISSQEKISYLIMRIFQDEYTDERGSFIQELSEIIRKEGVQNERDMLIRIMLMELHKFLIEYPDSILPDSLISSIKEILKENENILRRQTKIEITWFNFLGELGYLKGAIQISKLEKAWAELFKEYPAAKSEFTAKFIDFISKKPQQIPSDILMKLMPKEPMKRSALPYNNKFITILHIAQLIGSFGMFYFVPAQMLLPIYMIFYLATLIIKFKEIKRSDLVLAEFNAFGLALTVAVASSSPIAAIVIGVIATIAMLSIFAFRKQLSPYLIGTIAYSFLIKIIPFVFVSIGISGPMLPLLFIIEFGLGWLFISHIRKNLSQETYIFKYKGLKWPFEKYKEQGNFWDNFFSKKELAVRPEVDKAWINNLAKDGKVNPKAILSRSIYQEIVKKAGTSSASLDIDLLHRVILASIPEFDYPVSNNGFIDRIVIGAVSRIKAKGFREGAMGQLIDIAFNDEELILASISLCASGMPKTPFIDYLAHNAFLTAQPYYTEPRRQVVEDKPDFEELVSGLRAQIMPDTPILEQIPKLMAWLSQTKKEKTIEDLDKNFKAAMTEFPGHRDVALSNFKTFSLGQFSHSRQYAIVELVRNALHANRGLREEEQETRITLRDNYIKVVDNGVGMDFSELNYDLLSFTATGTKKFLQIAENFGLGFFAVFSNLLAEGDRVIVETFTDPEKSGYRIVVEKVNLGTTDTPQYEDRITITRIPNLDKRKGTQVEIFSDIERDDIAKLLRTKFRYHAQGRIVLDNGVREELINLRQTKGLMQAIQGVDKGASLSYIALSDAAKLPDYEPDNRKLTVTIDGLSILEFNNLPGIRGPPELVLTLPSNTDVNLTREQLSTGPEVINHLRNLIHKLSEDSNNISLLSDLYPVCHYIDELNKQKKDTSLTNELAKVVSQLITTNNLTVLPNADALQRLTVEPSEENRFSYKLLIDGRVHEVFFIHPKLWEMLLSTCRRMPFREYDSWLPLPFNGTQVFEIPIDETPADISFEDYRSNKKLRRVTKFGNMIFIDAKLAASGRMDKAISTKIASSPSAPRNDNTQIDALRSKIRSRVVILNLLKLHEAKGLFLSPEKALWIKKMLQRIEAIWKRFVSLFKRKQAVAHITKVIEEQVSYKASVNAAIASPIGLPKYGHTTDFVKLLARFHSGDKEDLKVGLEELEKGLLTQDDPLLTLYKEALIMQQESMQTAEKLKEQLEILIQYFSDTNKLLSLLGEKAKDDRVVIVAEKWFREQKEILEYALALSKDGKLTDDELIALINYLRDFNHPLDFQNKMQRIFTHANSLSPDSPLRDLLWRQFWLFKHMQPRDPRQTLNVATYGQNITDELLWIREYVQNQLDAILAERMRAKRTSTEFPDNFDRYRVHIPWRGRGVLFESELPIPIDAFFNAWLLPLVSQGKEEEGMRGEKGIGTAMSFKNAGAIFFKIAIPESDNKKVLYMRIDFHRNPRRMKWEITKIQYDVKEEKGFHGHIIHWVPMGQTAFDRAITQSDLASAFKRFTQTILWSEMQIWFKQAPLWRLIERLPIWQVINSSQNADITCETIVTIPLEQRIAQSDKKDTKTPIKLLAGRRASGFFGSKKITEITTASLPFKDLSNEGRDGDGWRFFKDVNPNYVEFLKKKGFTLDLGVAFRLTTDRTELARKDEHGIMEAILGAVVRLSVEATLQYFIEKRASLKEFPGGYKVLANNFIYLLEHPDSEEAQHVFEDVKAITENGAINIENLSKERMSFYNNSLHLSMLLCTLPIYKGKKSLYEIIKGAKGKKPSIITAAFETGSFDAGRFLLQNRKILANVTKDLGIFEGVKVFAKSIWQGRSLLSFSVVFFGLFLTEFHKLIAFCKPSLPEMLQNYIAQQNSFWLIQFSIGGVAQYIDLGIITISISLMLGIYFTVSKIINMLPRGGKIKDSAVLRHKWLIASAVTLTVYIGIIIYLYANMHGYVFPWDRVILDDMLLEWWPKFIKETGKNFTVFLGQADHGIKLIRMSLEKAIEPAKDIGEIDLILDRIREKQFNIWFPRLIGISFIIGIIRIGLSVKSKWQYPKGTVWVGDKDTRADSYTAYGKWAQGIMSIFGYKDIEIGLFGDKRDMAMHMDEDHLRINLHPIDKSARQFMDILQVSFKKGIIQNLYHRSYSAIQAAFSTGKTKEDSLDTSQAAIEYLVLKDKEVGKIEEKLAQDNSLNSKSRASSLNDWLLGCLSSKSEHLNELQKAPLFIRLLGLETLYLNTQPNHSYVGLPLYRKPTKEEYISHLKSIYPYIWVNGVRQLLEAYIESEDITLEELKIITSELEDVSLGRAIEMAHAHIKKSEPIKEKIAGLFDIIALGYRWTVFVFSYIINIGFGPWVSRIAYYHTYHKSNLLKDDFSSIFIGTLIHERSLKDKTVQIFKLPIFAWPRAILGGARDQLLLKGKLFLYGIIGGVIAAGIAVELPAITTAGGIIAFFMISIAICKSIKEILQNRKIPSYKIRLSMDVLLILEVVVGVASILMLPSVSQYLLITLPIWLMLAVFLRKTSKTPWLLLSVIPYLVFSGMPLLEIGKVFLIPGTSVLHNLPLFGQYLEIALNSVPIDLVGGAMFGTFILMFLSNLFSLTGRNYQQLFSEYYGREIKYVFATPREIRASVEHLIYDIANRADPDNVKERLIKLQEALQSGDIPISKGEKEYLLYRLNQAAEAYEILATSMPQKTARKLLFKTGIYLQALNRTLSGFSFILATLKSTFILWFAGISFKIAFQLIPWALDRSIEHTVFDYRKEPQVTFFEKFGLLIELPGDLPSSLIRLIDKETGLNLGPGLFHMLGGTGDPHEYVADVVEKRLLEDIPLWQVPHHGPLYKEVINFAKTLKPDDQDVLSKLNMHLKEQGVTVLSKANIETALENILKLNSEERNPYSNQPDSGKLLYADKILAAELLRAINPSKVLYTDEIVDVYNLPRGYSGWALFNKTLLVNLDDKVQVEILEEYAKTKNLLEKELLYYLIQNQIPIAYTSRIGPDMIFTLTEGEVNNLRSRRMLGNFFLVKTEMKEEQGESVRYVSFYSSSYFSSMAKPALLKLASYEKARRSLNPEAPVIFHLFDRFNSAIAADAWLDANVVHYNLNAIDALPHEDAHLTDARDGDMRGEIYAHDKEGKLVNIMDIRVWNWMLGKQETIKDIMERWEVGYEFSVYLENNPALAEEAMGPVEYYANLHALLVSPSKVMEKLFDPTDPASDLLLKAASHFRDRYNGFIIQTKYGAYFGLKYSTEIKELFPDAEVGKHYLLANMVYQHAEKGFEQDLADSIYGFLLDKETTKAIDDLSKETGLSKADSALLIIQEAFHLTQKDLRGKKLTPSYEAYSIGQTLNSKVVNLLEKAGIDTSKHGTSLPLLFWKEYFDNELSAPLDNPDTLKDAYNALSFVDKLHNAMVKQQEQGKKPELNMEMMRENGISGNMIPFLPPSLISIVIENSSNEELGKWISEPYVFDSMFLFITKEVSKGASLEVIKTQVGKLENALLPLSNEKIAEILFKSKSYLDGSPLYGKFSSNAIPFFEVFLQTYLNSLRSTNKAETIALVASAIANYRLIKAYESNNKSFSGIDIPVVNLDILKNMDADTYRVVLGTLFKQDLTEWRPWLIAYPQNMSIFLKASPPWEISKYLYDHRSDKDLMEVVASYHKLVENVSGATTMVILDNTVDKKDRTAQFWSDQLVLSNNTWNEAWPYLKDNQAVIDAFKANMNELNAHEKQIVMWYVLRTDNPLAKILPELFANFDNKLIAELWAKETPDSAVTDKLKVVREVIARSVDTERLVDILIGSSAEQKDVILILSTLNIESEDSMLKDNKEVKGKVYEQVYEWLNAHPSEDRLGVILKGKLNLKNIIDDHPELARDIIEKQIEDSAMLLTSKNAPEDILALYITLGPETGLKAIDYLIKDGKQDQASIVIRQLIASKAYKDMQLPDNFQSKVTFMKDVNTFLDMLTKTYGASSDFIKGLRDEKQNSLTNGWELLDAMKALDKIYRNNNSLNGLTISPINMAKVFLLGIYADSPAAEIIKQHLLDISKDILDNKNYSDSNLQWFYYADNLSYLGELSRELSTYGAYGKTIEALYANRENKLLIAALDKYSEDRGLSVLILGTVKANAYGGVNIKRIIPESNADGKPDYSTWDVDFWVSYLEARHFLEELYVKFSTQPASEITLSDFTPFNLQVLYGYYLHELDLQEVTDKALYNMFINATDEALLKWFEVNPGINVEAIINISPNNGRGIYGYKRVSMALEHLLANPDATIHRKTENVIAYYNAGLFDNKNLFPFKDVPRFYAIKLFGPDKSPGVYLAWSRGSSADLTKEQHDGLEQSIFEALSTSPYIMSLLPEGAIVNNVELDVVSYSGHGDSGNVVCGIMTLTNGQRFTFLYNLLYAAGADELAYETPEGYKVWDRGIRIMDKLPLLPSSEIPLSKVSIRSSL